MYAEDYYQFYVHDHFSESTVSIRDHHKLTNHDSEKQFVNQRLLFYHLA